jgi:hypothetical protein
MLAMICVDECTVASAFYIGCGRCWFAPRHAPEAEVYVPLLGSISWRPKVVVVELEVSMAALGLYRGNCGLK